MATDTADATPPLGARLVARVQHWHVALLTLASTYVLMLLGAYTSAIGAGLACPDWPTCYGGLYPFSNPQAYHDAGYTGLQVFAEWAHRTWAAATGPLILATAVTALAFHRGRRLVTWPAVAAVVILPLQVILGGLTVTRDLQPFIVTSHLGTAILILVALTVTVVAGALYERGRLE
jgi:cytochrome c oxidase assembly protein subunit 15